jgi:hypothetical protein
MDEVRTEDDERLDRNDFEGVQDLVYEASRVLAGGLVADGGVLAGMAIDATVLATTTIGEGILLTSQSIESPPVAFFGRGLHHDPAATWQAGLSTVNLAGVDPELPYIWARRELVDHDFETRRKWDSLLSDEVAAAQDTRRRSRIVFGVGNTSPDSEPGWTRIAKVASWDGGVPTINRIHAFDLFYSGGPLGRSRSVAVLFDLFNAVGLSNVLSYLVQQVGAILSSDADDSWITPPVLSLKGYDDRVSEIEDYHDVNGAKMLAMATADHTGVPDEWSYDLTTYVAHGTFGAGPPIVPAPILDDGEFFQAWRVPGRARQILLTRKSGGPNTVVPMELVVGDIVYNDTSDYSQFNVSCRKSSDGLATYGSYHLVALGVAQTP